MSYDPATGDGPNPRRQNDDDYPTEDYDRPRYGTRYDDTYEGSGYDDLPPSFGDDEFSRLDEPAATDDRRFEPVGDQEASELVRRYLFPTEKFRGEWRRHPIQIAKRLLLGVLATFLVGWLTGVVGKYEIPLGVPIMIVLWIAVMGYVLWDVIEWYYDRFVLTNKRIMLITGVITRDVAMMPLARVTDMKYTQTPLGRVLGYGTFEIESAGQDQALRRVANLPNPTDLYLQVVEEMYEPEASEARRRPPEDDGGT